MREQLGSQSEVRSQFESARRHLAVAVKRTWLLAWFAVAVPMMRNPRGLLCNGPQSEALQVLREAGGACHLLNLQFAWLAELLHGLAREPRNNCKKACVAWAMERTEVIAPQAQAGDSTTVWHLAQMMRLSRRRPRMPTAPVQDAQQQTVTSESELSAICVQQFSEEISGQVTRVSLASLGLLLAGRQSQTHPYAQTIPSDGFQVALPTVVEE